MSKMSKEDQDSIVQAIAKEFELPWLWRWTIRCVFVSIAVGSLALATKLVLWSIS